MRIRCYRCGMSYSLGKDEIGFAVTALKETGGNHYDARCPRCRHANRVSLEQLEQAAPAIEPEQTGKDTDTDTSIAETKKDQ